MKIIWSPTSLRHIESIGDFIALDSPKRAQFFVKKLINSVERLKDFPLSGSVVKESPNLKQIIVQGYRIVYRAKDKQNEIIAVLKPFQLKFFSI
jgi:addiction module RelE/StbE family toxin